MELAADECQFALLPCVLTLVRHIAGPSQLAPASCLVSCLAEACFLGCRPCSCAWSALRLAEAVGGQTHGSGFALDEVNAGGWAQWLTLPTTALNLLPKQCVCPPRLGKVMGLSRSSCRTITLHERVLCSLVTLVLDFNSTGVQDLLAQVYFFPPSRPEELFGQARLFFATGAPSYSCSRCGCPLFAHCVGAVVGGPMWPDEVNAGGWAQWLTLPTTALNLLPKQCVCPPRLGKVIRTFREMIGAEWLEA